MGKVFLLSNDDFGMESMLEIFIHETEEMLEDLDNILLESERARSITEENINTIFRITHTIKGSAAMMNFNSISSLAHSVEDRSSGNGSSSQGRSAPFGWAETL